MSSDLGSSLTSIDWLPRLSLPRARRCGGQGAGGGLRPSLPRARGSRGQGAGGVPQRKPPLSYTQLIAMAIAGSPGGRMTLREIYGWISTHFDYYRHAPSGWKNSIRHNLSVNNCFQKIPRSSQNSGKGLYWRLEGNIPERTISCQSVKAMPGIGELELNNPNNPIIPNPQGESSEPLQVNINSTSETQRKIPQILVSSECEECLSNLDQWTSTPTTVQNTLTQSHDPKAISSPLMTLGLGTLPVEVPLLETAFPFPEIDFADLNLSFHSVCRSTSNSGHTGSGAVPDESATLLHTPVLTSSPLPRSPFSPVRSPSRRISQRPETPRETNHSTGPGLPRDWMASVEGVKAGLEVAGNLDWTTIDLSQYPGQTETPIAVEAPLRPLDQNQLREFCFWLDGIFRDRGLIEAQAPGPTSLPATSPSDGGKSRHNADGGVTIDTISAPQQGQRLTSSSSEIPDEFDWDSIV